MDFRIDKRNMDFEKGITRLEQIVEQLEKNDISLEQALDCFQEGIELVKYCNNLLNCAEAKIKVLLEDNQEEAGVDEIFEQSGDI